mgnify:CR=1 FL=1
MFSFDAGKPVWSTLAGEISLGLGTLPWELLLGNFSLNKKQNQKTMKINENIEHYRKYSKFKKIGNHRFRAPWGRSETVEIQLLHTFAHPLASLRGENMRKCAEN